jgi:hypothetical protein
MIAKGSVRDAGMRSLGTLTMIVTIMVVIDALWSPVILLWAAILPDAFQTLIAPAATALDVSAFCFKVATVILFGRWIYVAGDNLIEADVNELEFTPGSRIWWFAVPIASLYKPFQGMRELWNASHGIYPNDVSSSLVATWWGLWLVNNSLGVFVGAATGRGAQGALLGWVTVAADIAVAIAAISLIRGIADAQSKLNRSALSEVFA